MWDFDTTLIEIDGKVFDNFGSAERWLHGQPDGKYYANWVDCPFGGYTPYTVIEGHVFLPGMLEC